MENTIYKNIENLGNELHKEVVNMETDIFRITFNPNQIQKGKKTINKYEDDKFQLYIVSIQPRIQDIIQIMSEKYNIENQGIPDKDYYDVKCDQIIRIVQDKINKNFCQNLHTDYVNNSLSSCNAVITLESKLNEIITFATIFFDVPNILHIDVICSNQKYRGGGNVMIDKIKEICKRLSIKEIKLSSVTESLGFYTKKDFECDELCNLKLTVKKPSNNKIGGIHKKTQKRRKNRTQKRRKSQNMKKKK
jgi:hypothetical protein